MRGVVGELAKLLQVHYDKFWLMDAEASYESSLKFMGKFPCIEKTAGRHSLISISIKKVEVVYF